VYALPARLPLLPDTRNPRPALVRCIWNIASGKGQYMATVQCTSRHFRTVTAAAGTSDAAVHELFHFKHTVACPYMRLLTTCSPQFTFEPLTVGPLSFIVEIELGDRAVRLVCTEQSACPETRKPLSACLNTCHKTRWQGLKTCLLFPACLVR
jgi:hypothetical protein